jgi:hypothetical protein
MIKFRKLLKLRYFLCYIDFSKPNLFHLHTDASNHQLGAVIMQDKNPIEFYSLKLNTDQKWYITAERNRELLSAIETCKKYKNILLGYHQLIIVFKVHKNNTFNGLKANTSDRVLHWLILLEEDGVIFEYLSGKKNVATFADALSHHDIDSLKIQEEEVLTLLSGSEINSISNIKLTIPIYTSLIFKEQAKVKELGSRGKGLAQPYYSIQPIEAYDLLCYNDNKQDLHFSIIERAAKITVLGAMNIYFIWDRLEQKRTDYQEYHDMAWSYTRC